MRLVSLELENIRSYEKEKFYFDSDRILLSGDIGSGKSTILYAVEFSFFGFIKGWVDGEKLLRKGKNFGSVKLEFEMNNKKYVIYRSIKKNKTIIQNEIILEYDGFQKKLSSEEIKAFILNLFKYPEEYLKKQPLIYRYTIFTPQEKMKEIISEKSEVRLNIIRKIFDIEKYNRIIENSKIIKDIVNKKISYLEGKIFYKKEYEKKILELEEKIEEYKKSLEKISIEYNIKKEKFKILEEEYKKFLVLKEKKEFYEKIILEKEKEKKILEENIKDYEKKILELEEKIKSLKEKIKDENEKKILEEIKEFEKK